MSDTVLSSRKSEVIVSTIEIENFKSFETISLDLNDFTVIIGKNSSGKSNFVDVFRFLRDMIDNGLNQAVLTHGGTAGIHNISTKSRETRIQISGNTRSSISGISTKGGDLSIKSYSYEIKFRSFVRKQGLQILNEIVHVEYTYKSEKNELTYSRNRNGRISTKPYKSIFKPQFGDLPKEISILQIPITPILFLIRHVISDFRIFDLDIKRMKEAVPIGRMTLLEEDGSNLPDVINWILTGPDKKNFIRNIKFLLDHVDEVTTRHILGSSHVINVKEVYSDKHEFAAPSVSEGTLNLIALVVAVKYQDLPFVIIEEPERFVHPSVLSRLMELFEEQGKRKQIIVTTHSPELVSSTELETIRLIERGKDGCTKIRKPAENVVVKEFIEGGLALGDMMIDNTL